MCRIKTHLMNLQAKFNRNRTKGKCSKPERAEMLKKEEFHLLLAMIWRLSKEHNFFQINSLHAVKTYVQYSESTKK